MDGWRYVGRLAGCHRSLGVNAARGTSVIVQDGNRRLPCPSYVSSTHTVTSERIFEHLVVRLGHCEIGLAQGQLRLELSVSLVVLDQGGELSERIHFSVLTKTG